MPNLLEDILGFGLENLKRFGQETGKSNQRMGQLATSYMRPEVAAKFGTDLAAPITPEDKAATMSEIFNLVNPIAGGIWRDLGLARQGGRLGSEQWLQAAKAIPGYERFKQLSQAITRGRLGNEFSTFRGVNYGDPLMLGAISRSRGEPFPAVTAASLKPTVGLDFAKEYGPHSRQMSNLLQVTTGPEAVLGLLPRRGSTFGNEAEMLLDPSKAKSITPLLNLLGHGQVEKADASGLIANLMREALASGTTKPVRPRQDILPPPMGKMYSKMLSRAPRKPGASVSPMPNPAIPWEPWSANTQGLEADQLQQMIEALGRIP